jgi:hypothetical protein
MSLLILSQDDYSDLSKPAKQVAKYGYFARQPLKNRALFAYKQAENKVAA